jgi:deoxyribonuclease-4
VLIGAHVSNAGGLPNAVARGLERECDAIQIFNQSPRAWKPTAYTDDDFAAFKEALAGTRIESVLIHAVYLINAASEDTELQDKSRTALTHALRVGDAIGADGVVLHAGSAKAGEVGPAIKRAGKVIKAALADTDRCRLHLENTAGTGGTLGRSFAELAELLNAAGGGKRLGVCLDSCHLLASGYDVRDAATVRETMAAFDEEVGAERLRSLHVNDSKMPLASNRDRHAPLGEGEIGKAGCAAFLSEPAFDGLPTVFEGPGTSGKGVELEDIRIMRKLREQGRARRRRDQG